MLEYPQCIGGVNRTVKIGIAKHQIYLILVKVLKGLLIIGNIFETAVAVFLFKLVICRGCRLKKLPLFAPVFLGYFTDGLYGIVGGIDLSKNLCGDLGVLGNVSCIIVCLELVDVLHIKGRAKEHKIVKLEFSLESCAQTVLTDVESGSGGRIKRA